LRPVDRDPGYLLKARQQIRDQRELVRVDLRDPNVAEVIDRGSETDRVDVRARAGFELPRKLVPLSELHRDAADHVAAVQERTHLLEYLRATPEAARPGRREQLLAAGRPQGRRHVQHV